MAYGLKYTVDFTAYQFRISENGYVGSVTEIEAANPACVHAWDEDSITAPIKGSAIELSVIGIPLESFYSDNDNQFFGQLFYGSQLLFAGFLVQDDCVEGVDDLLHDVTLSFTDNLGLLKDTAFNDIFNDSKISLAVFIQVALILTRVKIDLSICADLLEDTQTNIYDFFAQTFIAKESFLKSERVYESCYDILERILLRFNCTLLQKNGIWIIKRIFESAPASYNYQFVDGFLPSFNFVNKTTYNDFKVFGYEQDLVPIYGLTKRIERPYRVNKDTFDYRLPFQILKNADLKELGSLITTYSVDEETYKPNEDVDTTIDYYVTFSEYAMPHWYDSALAGPVSDLRIRVVTDSLGNELERYAMIQTDLSKSENIEATAGDIAIYNFNIRNAAGAVGTPSTLIFVIQLRNGTSTKYADEDGTWKNSPGYAVVSNNDYADWTNIEIKTGRIPFDGLLNVYLNIISGETHHNDMRFEFQSFINESTKVVGQTHTNSQSIETKNSLESVIELDDSPRNFISGTLFLSTLTGLIQTRTKTWNTGKRLGEVITNEIKQWRSRPRTILEGSFIGKDFTDCHVSPLTTFTNPGFVDMVFSVGKLEIDYTNKTINGTWVERTKTGETAATVSYKFDYKYNTK